MVRRVRFTLGAPRSRATLLLAPLATAIFACGGRDVTLAAGVDGPAPAPAAVPDPGRSVTLSPPGTARGWPTPGPSRLPEAGDPAGAAVRDEGEPPVTPGPLPVANPLPAGGATAPLDCSAITPAPASYELLEGFTRSEDFVFDELGNYVGIDDDDNLVRVSRNRERTLWLPNIGVLAGMGILPDGSVVFCEVNEGALQRVYPSGAVTVILGGLLYPNGLDIGPDGFVYVAENNAGRVRRVNPDTGEFTIVAMGLQGPNGVAVGNDPSRLYVGSFEGSGVYEVELGAPGELGRARVFARPPGSRLLEPALACPDQVEGATCFLPYNAAARCQALANVVDCLPVDPCPDLADGELCDYPGHGICVNHVCDPFPTCDELGEGAACQDVSGQPGVCQSIGGYPLSCAPPNPCDGLSNGAACEDPFFGTGVCEVADGYAYCTQPNPCDGLNLGDACEDPFSGPGFCNAVDDFTYCEGINPCDGLNDGDACVDFFYGPGVCRFFDESYSYCEPPNPCDGLNLGDTCEDALSGPGVCQASGDFTYCAPPGPCEELSDGTTCLDPFLGQGVCQSTGGYHYCAPPNPCDGSSAGASCRDPFTGLGECADAEGTLSCAPPNACRQLAEGDPCQDALVGPGRCAGGVCIGSYDPTGGGIDGLGVDACGNVYASEFTSGRVWRISPAGEIELLAQLPSAWIPNIKWGRGLGGFSSDVMYVADRDQNRLFGIYVGVPGATEFFATGR